MFTLVHLKVQDYDAWRAVFEANEQLRLAGGSKGAHVFRGLDDPNEVIFTVTWDDSDKARAFVASDAVREAMTKAGVIGEPDVTFMEDAGRTSA
jgi:heme-degrading monooxygenase HmoA